MKKILATLIVSFSLLSFTGCSAAVDSINNVKQTVANDSVKVEVRSDVKATVLSVNDYLVRFPTAPVIPTNGAPGVRVTQTSPTTTIVVDGNFVDFTVVGTDTRTGFVYTYDNETFKYTSND